MNKNLIIVFVLAILVVFGVTQAVGLASVKNELTGKAISGAILSGASSGARVAIPASAPTMVGGC